MVTYDAFISYCHAKDKPIADALQSVIQTLGKPWYRRRMLRIFRDDTSLSATPSLWPSIASALDQSRFLILLASHEAAASHWVQKEIDHWLQTKPRQKLLIALTDGALFWDSTANDFLWDADTPLPEALKGQFGAEPKWVDLRPWRQGASRRDHRFIELSADFAATIRNLPKEDILSQEVRQQRRALVLAWSAAAIMLTLVAVSAWQWNTAVNEKRQATTERNRAVEAQGRAERNYSAAKGTVDRLVFNITQQFRDTAGIRTETITRLLDAVKTTVDKLIEQNPDDIDLQISMSVMLDEFAKSYISAGDTTRAFTVAKQQVSLDRELSSRQPSNTTLSVNLIQSIARLADLEATVGDYPASEKLFRESFSRWQEFVKANPSNTSAHGAAAMASLRIGFIEFNSGSIEAARKSFEEALRITNDLGSKGDAFVQMGNVVALVGIAEVRLQQGQVDAAREANRQAIDRVREVARRAPDSTVISSMMAIALGNLALLDVRAGDRELADQTYDEAHKILRGNVERDPGNLQQKAYLLIMERQWSAQGTAAFDATAANTKERLEQAREMASHDPDNADWQMSLAIALEATGDQLHAGNRFADARDAFQEENGIAERFLQRDAKNINWQRTRSFSLQKLGDTLVKLNDRAEAQRDFTLVREFAENFITQHPTDTDWQRLLAVDYERLGDLHRSSGDLPSARDAYLREADIGRKLVAIDPQNDNWSQVLVYALNAAGDTLRDMNDPPKAQTLYLEWVEVARSRLRLQPNATNWIRSLAVAHERVGDISLATDPKAARAAYEADIAAARQLATIDQENPDWNRVLAYGLDRLGRLQMGERNNAAAQALFDEEIEICRRTLALLPGNDDWTWRLATTLEVAGQILAASNDWDGARKAYQEEADLARIGRDRHLNDDAWSGAWLRQLVSGLQRLGDAQFYGRDPDSSRDAYSQAVAFARQLTAKDPSIPLWQKDLLLSLWKDANLKIRDANYAEARRQLLEAIAITDALSAAKQLGGVEADWPAQLRERLAATDASLAKAH